jgi:hypothetical protein
MNEENPEAIYTGDKYNGRKPKKWQKNLNIRTPIQIGVDFIVLQRGIDVQCFFQNVSQFLGPLTSYLFQVLVFFFNAISSQVTFKQQQKNSNLIDTQTHTRALRCVKPYTFISLNPPDPNRFQWRYFGNYASSFLESWKSLKQPVDRVNINQSASIQLPE